MLNYLSYTNMKLIKSLRIFSLMAVLACMTPMTFAQDQETKIYDHRTNPELFWLTIDEVPNSALVLPLPPSWTEQQFAYDQTRYWWGKQQRKTPRGDLACSDADVTPTGLAASFSEPFGIEISEENTPELWALIVPMIQDAGDLACRSAKQGYMRTRPYVFYETGTCNPAQEQELLTNGSFPSGHSSIGWCTALVLSEINPEQMTQLLQTGFRLGESRVICGYHWQSDVDAGRIAGSNAYMSLHNNEGFTKQLDKAKKEFKQKKAEGKYHRPDQSRDFKKAAE